MTDAHGRVFGTHRLCKWSAKTAGAETRFDTPEDLPQMRPRGLDAPIAVRPANSVRTDRPQSSKV